MVRVVDIRFHTSPFYKPFSDYTGPVARICNRRGYWRSTMAMWKNRLRAKPGAGSSVARIARHISRRRNRPIVAREPRLGAGGIRPGPAAPRLSLIFGIFEFGRLGLSHLTARHAVAEATRYAVTGQTRSPTRTPVSRSLASSRSARSSGTTSGRWRSPTRSWSIRRTEVGPEELVTVSVSFTYRYFLPGLKDVLPPVDFTVRTAMKNEPFIR